mgnify:CR=1 FL=1
MHQRPLYNALLNYFLFFVVVLLSGVQAMAENNTTKTAIFAGGCFWCMEKPYEKIEGVYDAISGYTGGHLDNPSYEDVSYKDTGHYEAIKVQYDPSKVTYEQLLTVFWQNIDPFDDGGQFCDRGDQYRAAIFYQNEEEKELAQASLEKWQARFDQTIITPIIPASTFWDAEEYHQGYYERNPIRYNYYRYRCGRDNRLDEIKKSIL